MLPKGLSNALSHLCNSIVYTNSKAQLYMIQLFNTCRNFSLYDLKLDWF